MTYLERETGKLAAETASQERSQQTGQKAVAAVFGSAEALVRSAPRAVPAANALRLGNDIVPHDLRWQTAIN